eukprot:5053485-Ditylum_brightwellii.AAC.1
MAHTEKSLCPGLGCPVSVGPTELTCAVTAAPFHVGCAPYTAVVGFLHCPFAHCASSGRSLRLAKIILVQGWAFCNPGVERAWHHVDVVLDEAFHDLVAWHRFLLLLLLGLVFAGWINYDQGRLWIWLGRVINWAGGATPF